MCSLTHCFEINGSCYSGNWELSKLVPKPEEVPAPERIREAVWQPEHDPGVHKAETGGGGPWQAQLGS